MQISYKVKGAKNLAKKMGRDWTRVFRPRIRELAQIAYDFTRLVVPKRSHKLHDSLKLKKAGDLAYNVTEGAKHGGILRAGSPPHPIYPRRAKALYGSSFGRVFGPVAYVKMHPGFRANDYPAQAVKLTQPHVDRIGKEIENDVAKIVG